MGELLIRRREMALPNSPLPEWDYEWDSSKGLISDYGFDTEVHGDGGKQTIVGDYMQFNANSSNYTGYVMFDAAYPIGVMEAEWYIASQDVVIRMDFGNGGGYGIGIRMQWSTNNKGLFLGPFTATKLVTVDRYIKYKIRLVLKGQTGDVYLDDVLVAENVDVTSFTGCSYIFACGRATGNTRRQSRLYSLKMKFGRI